MQDRTIELLGKGYTRYGVWLSNGTSYTVWAPDKERAERIALANELSWQPTVRTRRIEPLQVQHYQPNDQVC